MAASVFNLIGRISMQGMSSAMRDVEGLEAKVKSVQKELGKLGQNLTKAGTFMSKNFTAPLGATAAAVGILSLKTGQYADKLYTLEQQTGMSTDSLQEFQHVATKAGGSADALFSTISAFSNKLPDIATGSGDAAEALDKLGINVTNADGSLRDANQLFPEIISKLQWIDDITTRNNLAFDIFGKKNKEIASFLGMSSEEMAKARSEAHELGLVMGDKALKQANDFKVGMETLKNQFAAVGRDISMAFIPLLNETFIPLLQTTLIPILRTSATVLGDLGKVFATFPTPVQAGTIAIGGFLAAIGPLLLVIGKCTIAIKAAIPVVASLGVTLGAASKAVAAFAMGIGGLITVCVGAAVALTALVIKTEKLNRETEEYNKQTKEFSRRTDALNSNVKAAANLVKEYEKLSGQKGFDPAKLEGLKTAHEDAVIALKNHAREMAGKEKLDETEILNTRNRMRGITELSEEEKRQTEYAIAQANERKKAYAQAAAVRQKELGDLVKSHQDATDKIMLSEMELLDKEEEAEIAKANSLKANEDQLQAIRDRYITQREDMLYKFVESYKEENAKIGKSELELLNIEEQKALREADIIRAGESEKDIIRQNFNQKRVELEQEAQKKIDEINKSWNNKLIQQSGDKLKILSLEYAAELEAAKMAGADLNAVHSYYINEEIKLRKELSAEKEKIDKEATDKAKTALDKQLDSIGKWVGAVVSMVASLGKVFSQYAKNQEMIVDRAYKERKKSDEKEFDERKKRIEADAKNNIITETEKNEQLKALEAEKTEQSKALDEEHEAQKLEIQRKQAKRQKAISLFTIATDTATAVMKAIKDFGLIAGGIMGGIITGLGAAQFALVASEPEPFFSGGLIKGSPEGIKAQIGERNQDEVVFPLQTGIDKIVDGLNASHSGNNTTNYTVNVNVGSFIGDRRGIQELGRKIREVIINENIRVGLA